jgi:hypothetical protein
MNGFPFRCPAPPRQQRNAALPTAAIERMMDRWEVPDRREAQEVEWWVDGHLPVL